MSVLKSCGLYSWNFHCVDLEVTLRLSPCVIGCHNKISKCFIQVKGKSWCRCMLHVKPKSGTSPTYHFGIALNALNFSCCHGNSLSLLSVRRKRRRRRAEEGVVFRQIINSSICRQLVFVIVSVFVFSKSHALRVDA